MKERRHDKERGDNLPSKLLEMRGTLSQKTCLKTQRQTEPCPGLDTREDHFRSISSFTSPDTSWKEPPCRTYSGSFCEVSSTHPSTVSSASGRSLNRVRVARSTSSTRTPSSGSSKIQPAPSKPPTSPSRPTPRKNAWFRGLKVRGID